MLERVGAQGRQTALARQAGKHCQLCRACQLSNQVKSADMQEHGTIEQWSTCQCQRKMTVRQFAAKGFVRKPDNQISADTASLRNTPDTSIAECSNVFYSAHLSSIDLPTEWH